MLNNYNTNISVAKANLNKVTPAFTLSIFSGLQQGVFSHV